MSDSEQTEVVSLDSWGLTTPETLKALQERSKEWRPELLALARQVHELLLQYKPAPGSLEVKWYIADGSLLGAFREGKMIKHDYDFDYGMLFLTENGTVADLDATKVEMKKLSEYLTAKLDEKFVVHARDEYSSKIEIYQPSSGIHHSNKGDWYNVHMDMQTLFTSDQTKLKMAYFRDNFNDYFDVNIADVLPLSEIEFEGKAWPCPKDPKTYLTALYGFIGSPAKYNEETRKYEPL